MGVRKINRDINWLGEFTDSNLESEFLAHDMQRIIWIIKPLAWMLMVLGTSSILCNYFIIADRNVLISNIIVKVLLILLTFGLLIWTRYVKRFSDYVHGITLYEIISVLCLVYMFRSHTPAHYLLQPLGITMVLLVLSIIPNRWINKLGVSLLAGISLFIASVLASGDIDKQSLLGYLMYTCMVIVLINVSSYLQHYNKRLSYIKDKEIIMLSAIDSLTGAYNRTKISEELVKWFNYSKRYDTPLSIMIIDFDNFKKINDAHGHLAGDNVLAELSSIIRENIRKTDVFGRWGGDEFVLVLPNTGIEQALKIAKRLREKIESNVFNIAGKMTCSIGLSQLSVEDNVEMLLHKTDRLLYKAKKTGKNKVVWHPGVLEAKGEVH